MRKRIDIAADGAVMAPDGLLGNISTRGSVMVYTEAGGRFTIETDSQGAMKFELSARYAVPEASIFFNSWWAITAPSKE
jgi:hypothetical protein